MDAKKLAIAVTCLIALLIVVLFVQSCKLKLSAPPGPWSCTADRQGWFMCSDDNIWTEQCSGGVWIAKTDCNLTNKVCNSSAGNVAVSTEPSCVPGCMYQDKGYLAGEKGCQDNVTKVNCAATGLNYTNCSQTVNLYCYQGECVSCLPHPEFCECGGGTDNCGTPCNGIINAGAACQDGKGTCDSSGVCMVPILYMNFDDGNATDLSGNGNNGTIYGATWCSDCGIGGSGAFTFDGENDYIDINSTKLKKAHNAVYNSNSISYVASFNGAGTIFHRGISSNNGGYIGCQYEPSINQIRTALSGCALSGVVGAYASSPGWNQIVVTFSKTKDNARVYMNGQVVANRSIYNIEPSSIISSSDRDDLIFRSQIDSLLIGASRSGNPAYNTIFGFFNGTLDEIRIYNYDLSESQVNDIST